MGRYFNKLASFNQKWLQSMLRRTYKTHYNSQNFAPLANGTDLDRQKYAILQTHWHLNWSVMELKCLKGVRNGGCNVIFSNHATLCSAMGFVMGSLMEV